MSTCQGQSVFTWMIRPTICSLNQMNVIAIKLPLTAVVLFQLHLRARTPSTRHVLFTSFLFNNGCPESSLITLWHRAVLSSSYLFPNPPVSFVHLPFFLLSFLNPSVIVATLFLRLASKNDTIMQKRLKYPHFKCQCTSVLYTVH